MKIEHTVMPKLPDWIQTHIDQYGTDPEKGHMWDSTVVGGQVAAKVFSAKAETVSESNRERYWEIMREIWPFYDDYQAKTDRKNPVVFLMPLG